MIFRAIFFVLSPINTFGEYIFDLGVILSRWNSPDNMRPCIWGSIDSSHSSTARIRETMDSENRCFGLRTDQSEIRIRSPRTDGLYTDIELVPSAGPDNNRFILYDPENTQLISRSGTDSIGVNFSSQFARLIGSMMLVPTNPGETDTHFRMIVSPDRPASYCYDSQLSMIDIETVNGQDVVEVEVSVMDPQSQQVYFQHDQDTPLIHRYGIDNAGYTRVPESVFEIVTTAIDRTLVERRNVLDLGRGCADIRDSLPVLNFHLRNHGTVQATIRLTGREYIVVDDATGSCHLLLYWGAGNAYILGKSVAASSTLFFDYRNNMLGFCEPL